MGTPDPSLSLRGTGHRDYIQITRVPTHCVQYISIYMLLYVHTALLDVTGHTHAIANKHKSRSQLRPISHMHIRRLLDEISNHTFVSVVRRDEGKGVHMYAPLAALLYALSGGNGIEI